MLIQTYLTLSLQMLLTWVIVQKSKDYAKFCTPFPLLFNFLGVLGGIIFMHVLRKQLGVAGQMALLASITVLVAIDFKCFVSDTHYDVLLSAFRLAFGIFVAMSFSAFGLAISKVDVKLLHLLVLFGLLSMMVVGIYFMFFGASMQSYNTYFLISSILFSIMIMVHTRDIIIQDTRTYTVPEAALQLYLDIIGLIKDLIAYKNTKK